MEEVILVNSKDEEVGRAEKLEAHQKGLLHRAISVLVFNSAGELLLQKRANHKYHSGGLWTNTCCSHPRPNETSLAAAKRRLLEEMGIHSHPSFAYKFIYKTALDNQLVEHEYDHVYITTSNDKPMLNPDEATDFKYVSIDKLKTEIDNNPDDYTVWFKIIMENYDQVLTKEEI